VTKVIKFITRVNSKGRKFITFFMETVGDRIKVIRDNLGLSMEALAQRIGVSSKVIINTWEKGKAEPSIKHLCAIAKAGNTTLDWLLLGDEDINERDSAIMQQLRIHIKDIEKLKKENEDLKRHRNSMRAAVLFEVGGSGLSMVADTKAKYSAKKKK